MKKLPFLLFVCTAHAMQQKPLLPETTLQTFACLQKLQDMAHNIATELKKTHDVELEYDMPHNPNPYCNQTQKGLVLYTGLYPHFIASPWGAITIFSPDTGKKPSDYLLATALLFKKVSSHFKGCKSCNPAENLLTPYLITFDATNTSSKKSLLTKNITPQELATIVGTNSIVWVEHAESLYEITAAESTLCPPVVMLPHKDYRPSQELLAEWNNLEKIYQKHRASNQ